MNVGENRARNGVMDCPESRNEEKLQRYYALGLFAVREGGFESPSRYAKNPKHLRIPNCFAVREGSISPSSRRNLRLPKSVLKPIKPTDRTRKRICNI
ncbi:hypothetical protein E3N88_44393 [Mikania micrantha]|uniref:Uncharacterized protein n=1 Tax=Mikania micrantha TaxID=192012 RepID=A0A5N6LC50_9ASTR|nr:hypothetical protein E3N88_44393 [Mikania micrantha]